MTDCQPAPGDDEGGQTMVDLGYTWCRPCREYHRPPECAILQDGSTAHWWDEPCIRAGGDAECAVCGKAYWKHPHVTDEVPTLVRACDGRLLKL